MSKQLKSILPGHGLGVSVLGNRREDIEYAIRLFKRKVKDSNIMDDLKERKSYSPPSVTKRKQKLDAIRTEKYNRLKGN